MTASPGRFLGVGHRRAPTPRGQRPSANFRRGRQTIKPHLPSVAQLLALGLGARLAWPLLPASVALAVLSGPAAVAALSVLDPNHADGIHAVKAGASVPFAVWALGVPWVFRPSPKRPTGSPGAAGG